MSLLLLLQRPLLPFLLGLVPRQEVIQCLGLATLVGLFKFKGKFEKVTLDLK